MRRSPARFSGYVLLLLLAVAAVMFGLFWLVGYDLPFDEDPAFKAPLLTDALIWFVYLLIILTVVVTGVSVYLSVRTEGIADKTVCGVPATRIVLFSALLLVVTMALTFAFASVEPLRVNGKVFTSAGWLRLTDMFINTSVTLVAVGLAAVAYGQTGLNRKLYHRKRR